VRRSWFLVGALVLGACGSSSSSKASDTTPIPPTSPAAATTTTTRGASASTSTTQPATPDLGAVHITTTPVVTGLDSPVALAWRANDTRMFVAEQTGHVRVVSADGKLSSTPLLTVGPLSNGNEEGLLGLAFSPDGTKLYVDYTDPGMDVHVDEYRMAGESAVSSSRRQVLLVQHPFANHNGGELVFGPDGMLYMSIGDGGSAGDPQHNGQNLGRLLAKILRIDPAAKGAAPYTVPADNPFVGRAGARPETWMWGLRNPWRFSFDRATGDMWIGDVGQENYEEVDFAPKGEKGINWGWSLREGLHGYHGGEQPAGGRDPILNTAHTDGNCAIVGGYVYRGRAIPALQGVYLFGDDCRTAIVGVSTRGGKVVDQRDLGPKVEALTTFGEDPTGEVYAVTREGTVFRFTQA
jgi:glucose/arabinose dehydrogenase